MTETLSTLKEKEVPKHRNALQEKYKAAESHVKRLTKTIFKK